MPRLWGIWTKGKLQILERYLSAFAVASKRSSERVYLDLFAGQPENRDRHTGEPIAGSAAIALKVGPPEFTRLHFFELPGNAKRLEVDLRSRFPNREIVVHRGDCNRTIAEALGQLRQVRWAPTFAFIDPNGPDCHWNTLVQVANHRHRQKTKVELWLLLPVGLFTRTLPTDERIPVNRKDAERITRMYGTGEWRHIYRARLAGRLTPAEAREEYLNLMRWRLEQHLGYRWTHPFEVFNEAGRSIYHMVFATDHAVGTKIMTDIYERAAQEFPAMRRQVRQRRKEQDEEKRGVLSLFATEELASLLPDRDESVPPYRHQPPWDPALLQRLRST